MKKIFTILLLSFLIINSIGFIVFYYYNQNLLKEEIKSYFLKNPALDKLELIKINKNQLNNTFVFKWINDKEIRYKGKLYDIYKEIEDDEGIYFYGINDKKEEELFANLSNYYNDKFNPKDVFRDKIRNFNQIFFYGFINQINSQFKTNIIKPFFTFLNGFYKTIVLDILSPPPKFSN